MLNKMSVALLAIGLVAGILRAEDVRTIGWRGDGSGRYPDANPPIKWGRAAKSTLELSAQAAKPKTHDTAPAADARIPDGVIRKWLVVSLPVPEGKKPGEEAGPNENMLCPAENDKLGDATWRLVTLDNPCLDFAEIFDLRMKQRPPMVAYAHAALYSPSAQPFTMALMYGGVMQVWVNGALIYTPGSTNGGTAGWYPINLAKGWNSVLFKVSAPKAASWYIRPSLFGDPSFGYEDNHIVWTTPLPALGSSEPIIVGDKLFVTAESGTLCCVNKNNGKLLWVRSNTYYDAVSEEEKKADAAAFAEVETVVAKLKKMDGEAPTISLTLQTVDERWELEEQIQKAMAKIDRKKYHTAERGQAGYTTPTPVSDGKYVYVFFGTCVTVCYDLEGHRQWISLQKRLDQSSGHGYNASPLFADGKLIFYMGATAALDAKTGKNLWECPPFYCLENTGCVLPVGGKKLAFLHAQIVNVDDGAVLNPDGSQVGQYGGNSLASPVTDKGIIYRIASDAGGVSAFRPSFVDSKLQVETLKTVKFDTSRYPLFGCSGHCASPLFHEKLIYCLSQEGVLTVVDMDKGEVLYQKQLDLDVFMSPNPGYSHGAACASPTLAGKYIYIFGNQGSSLVLEPGRTYKQVAKNRIEHVAWPNKFFVALPEHPEITMTCPVFEGKRLYYRGEKNLYCIGGSQ